MPILLPRLAGVVALAALLCTGLPLHAATAEAELPWTTLYAIDFADANQPIAVERNGASAHGVLPVGWGIGHSLGSPNRITATVMDDDGLTQSRFLRMDASREPGHRAPLIQFGNLEAAVARPEGEHLIRIRWRLRGSPNAMLRLYLNEAGWRKRVLCSGQWQMVEETFRLPAKKTDTPLAISLHLEGSSTDAATIDLRDFQLNAVPVAALAARLRTTFADGYPTNLLRTTRFPLGKPSTWTFLHDRYGSIGASASGDTAQPGPSGFPSLRVSSSLDEIADPWFIATTGIPLISEPFVIPDTASPHVFSCFVKGAGSVRLAIHHGWRPMEATTMTLTDTWQRMALPFTPALYDPKPHQAWFTIHPAEANAAVWIADVQLERATDTAAPAAGAYATRHPAEVQLSFQRPWHVSFADETPVVSWAASGDLTGAHLHARVTTQDGQERTLPPIPLSDRSLQLGELSSETQLGQVRIDAWIERDGTVISPVDEITVLRVERPRYWGQDAPNSFFGLHAKAHPDNAALAKALGFNWNRDWGNNWNQLEKSAGNLILRRERLQVYRDAHLLNMPVLAGTPDWAKRREEGLLPPTTHAPPDLAAYATFVDQFLAFHHGQVAAIEIGNEPWIGHHWCRGVNPTNNRPQPFTDPWQEFIAMTQTGLAAARARDPNILVVGINASSGDGNSGLGWTEAMLARGALDSCDAAAFHCYQFANGMPGDVFETVAMAPVHAIKTARPTHPVWMTEGSPNAHLLGQGLNRLSVPGARPDTELGLRGTRLVRYCVGQMAVGVDRTFLYIMGGAGFWEGSEDWGWRILTDPYGQPLPEAAAIAACAWHLEDAQWRAAGLFAPGVGVHLFTRADGAGIAVLGDDLAATDNPGITVPAIPGVSARDRWGNPLQAGDRVAREVVYLTHPDGIAPLATALGITVP